MNTCKIKFTAVSIAWTEGGIMLLSVKANAGSDISVDWGDGRNDTHFISTETQMDFRHDYFPKHTIPPHGIWFHVEIGSNCPDCRITSFCLYPMDMDAIDLDVSNCTELEELSYSGCVRRPQRSLDLSRNTALKYLYCPDNNFTSLDLSNNTALEHLHCRSNRLLHLNLSNNIALKCFQCGYNNMEKIFIYYAPQLREAEYEEGNNIDDDTRMRIQQIIADNNISSKKEIKIEDKRSDILKLESAGFDKIESFRNIK